MTKNYPPPPATFWSNSNLGIKIKCHSLIVILIVLLFSACKKNLAEEQKPDEPPQIGVSAKDINWSIDSLYGMVVFKSFEDYHKYWDCYEKEIVHESMKKAKFVSLHDRLPKLRQTYNPPNRPSLTNFEEQDELPWFFQEDLSNFTQILNPQGLLTIDQYTIRVDDFGEHVFISEYIDLPTLVYQDGGTAPVYQALINDINVQNHVYKYPTDYDIVDMLEENGINNGAELMSLFCWKRGGAKVRTETPAVYFLDETVPGSIITTQANSGEEGTHANTRMALRLQYLRLGVFFQLMLKAKYQEVGYTSSGNINWKSDVAHDRGENRWNLVYTEKHQGKCKNENEIFNSGTLTPPLNERNKTRRVFWERANGLHKYQISATLNLYTKTAWRGRKTSSAISVQPNHVFDVPNARMVNSMEIFDFTPFFIQYNY